ncbi:HesA/MoeB/ThiF family protein [Proteocatella sphenisci]|uniref:HesA/MoeB/ThiF family protein n=1 Tax=Proteocatella sphenisci TaxID=181070 RepID=UPI000491B9DA|nr:HesA/MoeB/ThiF family protein [Proteocatella sphenisci]
MDRYSRNMKMLTQDENVSIRAKKIAVIGCGGLGGYITEMLARLGVGKLIVVDGDVFEETNLNRQILSVPGAIGNNKASQAKLRIGTVNPEIIVTAYEHNLTRKNASEILLGCDIVMDALDNIGSRLMLEEVCEEQNIPLVHGAISGWYGQVSTIIPGDRTLSGLYSGSTKKETDNTLGNPSFTPALIASFQVSEALKIMISRGKILQKKIMFINTYDNSFEIVDMS